MPDYDGDVMPQSLHPLQDDEGGGYDGDPPPGGTPVADAVPPTLGNITPADLDELEPDAVIAFDVTDNGTLYGIFVWVAWVSGVDEVVFDGTAFRSRYAESTREAIVGGWHFEIARVGGWPRLSAELQVEAIDPGGNRL
jgi:hypothetical protein